MDLSIAKLKNSLMKVNSTLKSKEIKRVLSQNAINSDDVDEIVDVLCKNLYDDPNCAENVKDNFGFLLLPIVSKFLKLPEQKFEDFQRKAIALSILMKDNNQVMRSSLEFFQSRQQSPFIRPQLTQNPAKKAKFDSSIKDIDIVKMCLRFLKSDLDTYRRLWNWKEFFDRFHDKGCDLQKYLCNQIVSMLFGMSNEEVLEMNKNVPKEVIVEAEMSEFKKCEKNFEMKDEGTIEWKLDSDTIACIEGIYLPYYDRSVSEYYADKTEIVRVESTRVNLRSLAMGISSGKAICLSGPVGSGKTCLVEYMAKKVGRICPKIDEFCKFIEEQREFTKRAVNGNKRKIEAKIKADVTSPQNGFVRIQLGDQTDSKVLLGQYRCTDVPGEFVWQPGVLTQAVMNGYWLLLEDIDCATQDVCTVLTNLLENNFLRVPGFRENLKIASGFQLFVTLRTQKSAMNSNSAYSLLEKYLYTINMVPLSRSELAQIICENYPKLSTISTRIVDVFLIFSSGCHAIDEEKENIKENGDQLPQFQSVAVTLPNSGRTVSTRDLLKLCRRSSLTFQVTSVECAYLVFQNCVDLFCSYLPAGQAKTDLIISIGARLGIIETRCIHLSNEFKPIPRMTSDEFSIGRALLSRHSLENNEKRVKMSDRSEKPPTFSFTRVSSCVLERISVCVQQNEPILLVGETGVGKTSSIQYLAYQTSHKLVVVNMNNQSDVSDLIGGFKPVDMSFIISPLRNEFENLFARAFDLMKNEKFLGHVAGCFNSQNYTILIKLMLKVIPNVQNLKTVSEDDLKRWEILEKTLKKLEKQLKTSASLSFAFIPGSLVNCIKNGDWVLLDEINLASTETLECLSTILEPDGSVILLERGDFVPIKRHPDFRIFACMNPSTDVGKKDLPTGIRNRFTEFFVDELTVENDLLILVGDYLNNTGIEKSRIHKAVQLYQELKNLSQLELNDGLGNKPVFSLRTLCRALRICAKNLCGSIERNIYESFCLSFLTQLDAQSHDLVLSKIQKYLVSDAKKILNQQIPKPAGNQMNFEGYWIEIGEKEPLECKEYILTNSVQKNLKDLARIISIGKLPILLQGPTSAGKTSLIEYIAKKSGNHCLRINNHEHTDLQEYIGTYVADLSGKLVFQEGVLVQAMRNGYWIILDELNLAPSDILEALNRVLDDNRELFIPETQVVVKAHPNFMLFATQNPPGLYGGRKTLSRAFKNRFIELHFCEIPKNELEIILEKRCQIPMKYAQKMVKTMSALQINRRTTSTKNNFTLRDLFRWGNRYTFADPKLLEDRNYDWNQHLVDEGFLVLSAKVRNQVETEIITETLHKNFSKKIDIENLFSLNEKTSMVTKSILESLMSYKGSQNVVWTFQMRRMAVLVSKSLQFNEPVLLVGFTGCGKTTVCQILAELSQKSLRILNCHMHTEGADFLGGLRPHRDASADKSQLFEWSDGPLVLSMMEGNFFLADEISLAEDSVLERLNCVLEPDRTLLLAEKGGGADDKILDTSKNSEFIVKASDGFQFLATMNPGGDFGKKELSPALRNRFTEIWCTAIYSDEDLMKIAENAMVLAWNENEDIEKIAKVVVKTVAILKSSVEKLNFSIRDVLAWINFITKNYSQKGSILTLNEAFFYGAYTIFLDALEMLPYENFNDVVIVRRKVIDEMEKFIKEILDENVNFSLIKSSEGAVEIDESHFGIAPFYLEVNESAVNVASYFSFSAPTTKNNLFRVLSAMSLKKAILLEGPPGVGKSSLIENIANTIGYNIVRINLCEHTDLADLFGTDLPAESSIFESENDVKLGAFVWRDGPLLAALKSPNTWILLDELNLAPQSVLEGLNAILDHRGEVFIPELNKTFKLGQQTRIFATQNPLRQGGGRKGLPQSFLNRFTKVYLRKLEKRDLLHVISHNFGSLEDVEMLKYFKLLERMVEFSERVEHGITNLEFGYKGGPFEVNLRDILRWCELISNPKTGCIKFDNLSEFLLILYEKMKLVYCQRMRAQSDIHAVLKIFGDIFEVNVDDFEKESSQISLYWTDTEVFLNDICLERNLSSKKDASIILSSQKEELKNVAECVIMEKPIILCGPSDCGKTKIINTFCAIFNKDLELDTIDDSVTGSFQQFDLNRVLEEMWEKIEKISFQKMSQGKNLKLFELWREHEIISANFESSEKESEIEFFIKRLSKIVAILEYLKNICDLSTAMEIDKMLHEIDLWKKFLQKSSTLNTGGHFEWVDSMIVKSIKFGHFICLEHINLVSSAILDRLNPVLEPNGTLMISEKGVTANNEPETISKHKNLRIFLTMDPKHGEVSRAMRNRCIELSISHQNYSEDDLRKLIYIQGVHEMHLIRTIVDIHKNLQSISDFTPFGVSHAIKMAFLVSQNKTFGLNDKKCLQMSAMEVYVRSSNIDLLGFGLPYYRSKLKGKIDEIVDKMKPSQNLVNYENFIVNSAELSTMKMIKLQAESMIALMRCKNENELKNVLTDLHTKLADFELKSFDELSKYFLTFFYMMSTIDDVDLRWNYLKNNLSSLKALNDNLHRVIKDAKSDIHSLPWNFNLFPRLRAYDGKNSSEIFKTNLSLLLEMTLKEIVIRKSTKISEIDAISYSKAVLSNNIADTIENRMLTKLYKLLSNFKAFAKSSLENLKVEDEKYTKILLAFLWFNRVLEISQQKLYNRNNLRDDLIDELNLHFKWLGKHCVGLLTLNDHEFMETFNDIQNFILSHHHSLQLCKKIYVKNFTSFLPFYDQNQASNFKQLKAFTKLLQFDTNNFEHYQKLLTLLMSTSYKDFRKIFFNNQKSSDIFEAFKQSFNDEMIELFGELESSEGAFYDSSNKIKEYEEFMQQQEASINFKNDKFDIEMIPVMELFIFKALQASVDLESSVNIDFALNIPSIGPETLLLIKILNDPRYEKIQKVSSSAVISSDFKKLFSSFKMTLEHDLQKLIQNSTIIKNYELCRVLDDEEKFKEMTPTHHFINGPLLTKSLLDILLQKNGIVRGTGLGEVDQWKSTLNRLRNLLWSNAEMINSKSFNMLQNDLKKNQNRAQNLIENVEVVRGKCLSIENENFNDFKKDFWSLIENLKEKIESTNESWLKNFVMTSLIAAIELNLMSYFPLIDPVKKNSLKTKYIEQDIDHLEKLLLSYKFMSIILDYDNLGNADRKLLNDELKALQEKLSKSSRKVALRPEICLYSSMVKDVNHFLISFCHPKQILSILSSIESSLITKSKNKSHLCEFMSKLDLWVSSADKFINHTLRNYQIYYRDFIAPIEFSVVLMKNGFLGLRALLQMQNDSIVMRDNEIWDCNENGELLEALKKLIAFPSKYSSINANNHLLLTIETLSDDSEQIFFKLVKSQIHQISNTSATVESKLNSELFVQFDKILNVCNQVWQKQEENRRKKQIEEDSLYVTKTKCAEDDEETVKQREIEEIFPETTNDFFEYSQKDTLEQIKVIEKKKKFIDTISDDDYKFIGDLFINMMSGSLTAKNYLAVFNENLKVFHSLFEKFSTALESSLDDRAFCGMSFLIGVCQEKYDDLSLRDSTETPANYNFYKDANISEAIRCIEVMKNLEERVNKELEQWPEHAVLNDILIIINRIRSFPSTSPLVRFNVGMQILRQKVNDWNQVAHKLNNFKDIECEIAGFIQSWMQMELQCWRESLNQTFEVARGKAYRYWFFLYNLVHEFLDEETEKEDQESSLVDIKKVEKRFGEDCFEEKVKGKISISAITNVLKQFIESSNYAEFSLRMRLMKAFESYIEKLNSKSAKARQLSAVIHNLFAYFSQFSEKVQEQIDFVRRPIEDKLRKFVKINSFNKDLSYFSTESNIKQVHRNLHKHLKEFDVEIKKKIVDLFLYRDSGSELDADENAAKAKSFLNLEAFLIPKESVPQIEVTFHQDLPKFTSKSREIVKKTLSNSIYSTLIESVNETISTELETCNHLRSLKVDENLPRSKQKSQAKSILNQKRKALTDFFKLMTSLGMNYKSGLLTNSLNSEILDLKIAPYSIEKLKLINDDGKADLYFNKSILKMKLLTNILLAPHVNIDFAFLERIKGFSIDLFAFVQSQRENLSVNVNQLNDLRELLDDFESVMSNKTMSFEKEHKKMEIIRKCFVEATETIEQLKLLLKCAPESENSSEFKAIVSSQNVLYQKGKVYQEISSKVESILSDLKINYSNSKFITNGDEMHQKFTKVLKKLKDLKQLFTMGDEISVFGHSISELYEKLENNLREIKSIDEQPLEASAYNLEEDLQKLSHSILLSIQNIYKEHREKQEETENEPQNQLKEKLHSKLATDMKALSLSHINSILKRASENLFKFCDENSTKLLSSVLPLIKQYKLLSDFFVIQQFNAHRLSAKMLSIMLSVFLELAKNGFCVPENLLSDEEQKEELDKKPGEGFGFEDGQGEKDVSDKLESEDQLDEAKRPEDYKKGDQEENKDLKEEKGIDMSENFEGKMHDMPEDGSDESDNENEDKEEMDKEMGDTGEGAEKLDDQIWGSDDENEPQQEDMEDETGKGSGDKDEQHNDLAAEGNDADSQTKEDGLDAASQMEDKKEKRQQKKDIDNMDDQGEAEDQINPYHNELEEPQEPEDLNLDEEMNLDNQENDTKEPQNEENPLDIDKMKDGMEVDEDVNEEMPENKDDSSKKEENENGDSSDDENATEQPDLDNPDSSNEEDPNAEESEEAVPQPDAINPDEDMKDDSKPQETPSDYHESKDKKSKEQNVQSMPNQKEKSSNDQVQTEKDSEDPNQQQEMEIDDQDTGEDREGVGQAENKESKSGHQGIADTKETQAMRNRDKNQMNQKRKKGNTNEERTLGDVNKMENKFLKTVEKINREQNDLSDDESKNEEAEEYQHVKDAKKSDKTTLDNATEEQSKKVQHDENAKDDKPKEEESTEDLMDVDRDEPEMFEKREELHSNKLDQKSDKKSTKKDDRTKDRLDNPEEIEIDGENVTTFNVPRGDETTAHCQMDIVNDTSACEEQSNAELLEIRKAVEAQMTSQHVLNPEASDMEKWQEISNRMMSNARELCEQLRLILEPTKCTRLKGDYRTGRRINMKKIIPYIASQFRKDKIWLRRTKAAQRDYKITIAVDDSKSMDHNNSKELTLQAISLVSQALTLLESGKLSVVSFGESSKVLLKYNEQFNGPKLFKSLNFSQNKTRIAELLDFSRVMNQDSSSDAGLFEHLLIILSDGRNIFSEGEKKVKNAIKMARLQRVFIIYIIIDNPTNKDSILDIRTVLPFNMKDKTTTIVPYMNQFPFPYYVIVRDLNQLPLVLSEGLRQWFELVNSE